MVGDTITDLSRPAEKPLPGYKPVKPMVYSGIYPVSNEDYEELKSAMVKLRLSDSSFIYEPEISAALGFGFRCGFGKQRLGAQINFFDVDPDWRWSDHAADIFGFVGY